MGCMRVCIDVSAAVHRRAGLGRYAQELVGALAAGQDGYTVFYHQRGQAHLTPPLDHLPRITTPLSVKPWRLATMLAYFAGAGMDAMFPGVDVFHATEHLLPRLKRIPAVFTLHDLIFRFDPDSHKALNRIYLNLMMPRFLRAAQAIIAVSQCSRQDAVRLYNVPAEKIHVIYEGVDPRFKPATDAQALESVRLKYSLPQRFILHVGTIEPRKNLPALFEAFSNLAKHPGVQRRGQSPISNLKLVIAGKKGWLTGETFERAKALGGDVVFTGYVADADLPTLYTLAELLVMPSVYEGFGLPVLEAMACGAPVACSNTSSLPEIAGDAALLFDPHDVRSIAQAIGRAIADSSLRAALRARGLDQAARFTWAEAARQTRQVYEQVGRAKTS
jgi:glycosyltransferase involved in cell wall biosynthesis